MNNKHAQASLKKARILRCILLTTLLATFWACSEDSSDNTENNPDVEETPGDHACEHVQDLNLAIDRSARDQINGSTVDVSEEHRAYKVTLAPMGDQFVGFVDFEADIEGDEDHGEFYIFRNPNVPLEVTEGNGDIIELEETNEADNCEALETADISELETGAYVLKLGPTDQQEVVLVIEHASHEGHDDHDEQD